MTEGAEEAAGETGHPGPRLARSYPITRTLVGVNIVLYVLMRIAHGIWPGIGPLRWGADWGPLSLSGQWWRLLTATFTHFSLPHLLGNMLFLWIFGRRLESILGKWTFLLFYVSCGLAGSISGLAFHPDAISCGASGAVFGLGGGLAGAFGIKGLALSKRAKWKLALLIAWIAYSIYPADPDVDNAAHAAGLLTGLVLGALLTSPFATAQRRRWVFSGVAAVILLGAVSVRFYRREVASLGPAASYLMAGRTDEALGELNAVLRREPDNTLANGLAAATYLEKRDDPNAEAAARRLLNRDPDNDLAIDVLGTVEFRTGRCSEAYVLVGKQAMRNRQLPLVFLLTGCNYLAQGDRYLSAGKADLAIEAYQDALKGHADEYQAQVGLAKAYELAGKSEEAKAAAARAAEMQQSGLKSH